MRIDSTSSLQVACLGFSANPPRKGHRDAARRLLYSHRVNEVWLIPVFAHPFQKEDMESWEHRFLMSGLLDEPGIRTSPIEWEIEEKERRGASYTLYTVRGLKEKFPSHTFLWCVGSDIVLDQSYLRWHEWEQLQKEITFLMLERPGYELGSIQLPECFELVREYGYNIARDISSTEVRAMIRLGKDITPHVGKKVAQYIKEHKLYQTQGR